MIKRCHKNIWKRNFKKKNKKRSEKENQWNTGMS